MYFLISLYFLIIVYSSNLHVSCKFSGLNLHVFYKFRIEILPL
nr:MAG TPA: hypothetical protein [Caudoviricetes sp.]